MPAAPSDRDERSVAGPSGARTPWLVSDTARYAVAAAVAMVLTAVCTVVVVGPDPARAGTLGFVATVYFGGWSAYCLLHAGITWRVLRGADGEQLADWLVEDRRGRRRRLRVEWLAGSGGPLGAVSLCALAIGAVLAASLLPQLRDDPVVIGSAVLVVATSWLLIVAVYAVHYARENTNRGGLAFRGEDEGPPRLSDYTYLAVQVGTAYNGADVVVTGRAMRRTVTLHGVVAFVFNSVLIALLVTLVTIGA